MQLMELVSGCASQELCGVEVWCEYTHFYDFWGCSGLSYSLRRARWSG